jgi:hypothetical protein
MMRTKLAAHVVGRDADVPFGAGIGQEHESQLAVHVLLVALHGSPGLVAVDANLLGMEHLLHLADVPARQA